MKKYKYLIFSSIVFSLNLFGVDNLESQQVVIPSEDQTYKYYLGVAEGSSRLETALLRAHDAAAEEAIKENFGVYTKIDKTVFEDNNSVEISSMNSVKTDKVKLNGFEKVQTVINLDPMTKKYDVKTLFRYSKKSIAEESLRLKNSKVQQDEYSEIGQASSLSMASLEIKTSPVNTSITIDGVSYLSTPIKILGQITPGHHQIILDHPNFEKVVLDINFKERDYQKRQIILKPAKALLTLDSNTLKASVYLNKLLIGETPIVDFPVDAGVKHNIILKHSKAYEYQISDLIFSKGSHDLGVLEMKIKPGYLVISSQLVDPEILIDGNVQPIGQRRFELASGYHKLTVSKDGYIQKTISFEINPTETVTQNIELEKLSVLEAKKVEKELATKKFNEKYYLHFVASSELNGRPVNNVSNGISCFVGDAYFGKKLKYGFSGSLKIGAAADLLNNSTEKITNLTGVKLGVWENVADKHEQRLSFGLEYESSDLDISSKNSKTKVNKNNRVSIYGIGPSVVYKLPVLEKNMITFKGGIKDMKSDNKVYAGEQQVFVNVGFGVNYFEIDN